MSDRPVTECIPEDAPPPGDGMRWIPGGTFRMGDDNAYLEEAPAHAVAVSGFWIAAGARALTQLPHFGFF